MRMADEKDLRTRAIARCGLGMIPPDVTSPQILANRGNPINAGRQRPLAHQGVLPARYTVRHGTRVARVRDVDGEYLQSRDGEQTP